MLKLAPFCLLCGRKILVSPVSEEVRLLAVAPFSRLHGIKMLASSNKDAASA